MKCKLCQENVDLVRKSHIIPDFMYKELFDDKHRFFEAKIDDDAIKKRIHQSGIHEPNILCKKCENERLGNLERYASMFFYKRPPEFFRNEINRHGMKYTLCKEIHYSNFRLFLLSIIWRASISKLPNFNDVNLGPHENSIREMILYEDPGDPKVYPCLMVSYLNQKEIPHQIIGQFILSKKGGAYTYFILIGGILYIYFISHHNIPSWIYECVLNTECEMKIVHMFSKMASNTINTFIGMDIF